MVAREELRPFLKMERLLQEIRDGILELQRRVPPPAVPVEVPPVPPCRVPPEIERVPPVVPAVPPVPPPAPPMMVELSLRTIIQLANAITSVLERFPNRLEKIEIDTSQTTQRSLRSEGKIKPAFALGFWVEGVGGGFSYIIVRDGFGTAERTAAVDDKWDIEFDDLLITGAGVAGTATIWYWWLKPE